MFNPKAHIPEMFWLISHVLTKVIWPCKFEKYLMGETRWTWYQSLLYKPSNKSKDVTANLTGTLGIIEIKKTVQKTKHWKRIVSIHPAHLTDLTLQTVSTHYIHYSPCTGYIPYPPSHNIYSTTTYSPPTSTYIHHISKFGQPFFSTPFAPPRQLARKAKAAWPYIDHKFLPEKNCQ